MTKEEFLTALQYRLYGLPQDDIAERLAFYGEMIDDSMEEGMTEEEAVASIGTVDEIVAQIIAETPLTRLVKEKIAPKRSLRAWEIVLLILGFPLWFSLLLAAGSVLLSLYIVAWALIICLWAAEIALIAGALAGFVSAGICVFSGRFLTAAAFLGAGLFCAGLSVFMFFGCVAASKGILHLTKKILSGIKNLFVGKE